MQILVSIWWIIRAEELPLFFFYKNTASLPAAGPYTNKTNNSKCRSSLFAFCILCFYFALYSARPHDNSDLQIYLQESTLLLSWGLAENSAKWKTQIAKQTWSTFILIGVCFLVKVAILLIIIALCIKEPPDTFNLLIDILALSDENSREKIICF